MRFGVLGPLRVEAADSTAVTVPETKVRALLADLLVHRGRSVSADTLVEDVWGANLPANPTGALQTKMSQLRRVLADAGGPDLVTFGPAGYRLQADVVDSDRFAELAATARTVGEPRRRAELFGQALALWRGPAFADFADFDFTRAAIAKLTEDRLTVLEEQAEARLALGEHGQLVGELADLVVRHPLRERLRAAHLRALYLAGRQHEALAGYQELRELLADELGLLPGPELTALHQAMLTHDPALTPTRRRSNLPAPLTGLIGRTSAIAEVAERLAGHRLVTLTGPGGVGKTRLALAAAAELVERHQDGVWLVELAGAPTSSTVDELAELVVAALGIRDDATETLEALRDKRMLLVLDNCEQVVAAAAELVVALLARAPELRVLATSREPLGPAGEAVWPVPPLDLPDVDADQDALRRSGAVELFAARARAASPGFTLDDHNSAAVAEVCRRLDGLPLALELAATRVRALRAEEIRDRLDDRFRLLASGSRGGPQRQQTLRAAIDWSWDLLTPTERTVLRRLAVQVDGFDIASAETVCADQDIPADDVVGAVIRLVDRGMVTVVDGPRYRLLESVAAYGIERLAEAGETDLVRLRHHRHQVDLAERATLCGPDQRDWLRRLDVEAGNLRAALAGLVRVGDRTAALRLVNALAWYWFLRGRLREAHRWTGAALAVPGEAPAELVAMATTWRTGFALLLGDGDVTALAEEVDSVLAAYAELDDPAGLALARWFLTHGLMGSGDLELSAQRVNQALDGFIATGNRWGEAAALHTRATLGKPAGDLSLARRDAERALAIFDELGDRWGQCTVASELSTLAEIAGDYPEAARLLHTGLAVAEELGLWTQVSYALSGLGRITLLQKDFAASDRYHQRARQLAAAQSHTRGEQYAEVGLGLSARRQGRLDDAEAHLTRWLEWCRRMDGDLGVALILAELGFVAELRGDVASALARHLDGLSSAEATGDRRAIALAVEGLAGARSIGGDPTAAAVLLGAAARLRHAVCAPLPQAERGDVDRITRAAESALGQAGFVEAFALGETQTLTRALALAGVPGRIP